MALRPCLSCGKLARDASRCPECERAFRLPRDRAKLAKRRALRPYTSAERTRRAATVAAWRAKFGDWCPGFGRGEHASTDLTADHVVPVAAGGAEDGPLTVLCRSCNSRKHAG